MSNPLEWENKSLPQSSIESPPSEAVVLWHPRKPVSAADVRDPNRKEHKLPQKESLFSKIKPFFFWTVGDRVYQQWKIFAYVFQSVVVNTMSTLSFLKIACPLGIAGWLRYKSENPLLEALNDDDMEEVEWMVKRTSREAFYDLLRRREPGEQSALEIVTEITNDYRGKPKGALLSWFLEAIEPKARLSLLKELEYGFFLVSKGYDEEIITTVLNALPEEDRFDFLDQVHPQDVFTALIVAKNKKTAEVWLKHYPKDRLWDYATRRDLFGRTALIEFLWKENENALQMMEYLITLFPEVQRKAFLDCFDQGKKAMWIAQADGQEKTAALLEKYGVPQVIPRVTGKEIADLTESWRLKESEWYDFFSILQEKIVEYRARIVELGRRSGCASFGVFKTTPNDAEEERSILTEQRFIESIQRKYDTLSREITLASITALVRGWEKMPVEERERELSFLEQSGLPIPKDLVRLETLQETLVTWHIIARLEEAGVTIPNGINTEAVLEMRDKELLQRAIEGFYLLYGKDPAEILGISVSDEVNSKVIQKAYYKAIRKEHPDKRLEDPTAEEKAQLIIGAYMLYTRAESRRQYLPEKEKNILKREDELKAILEQKKENWRYLFSSFNK